MISSLPSLSAMFRNQYGEHLPQQGWSKYGEPMFGLLKETLDEWACQSCGEKQIGIFPSYMIPIDEHKREYIRVCVWCKAKAVDNHLVFCHELLKFLKKI